MYISNLCYFSSLDSNKSYVSIMCIFCLQHIIVHCVLSEDRCCGCARLWMRLVLFHHFRHLWSIFWGASTTLPEAISRAKRRGLKGNSRPPHGQPSWPTLADRVGPKRGPTPFRATWRPHALYMGIPSSLFSDLCWHLPGNRAGLQPLPSSRRPLLQLCSCFLEVPPCCYAHGSCLFSLLLPHFLLLVDALLHAIAGPSWLQFQPSIMLLVSTSSALGSSS